MSFPGAGDCTIGGLEGRGTCAGKVAVADGTSSLEGVDGANGVAGNGSAGTAADGVRSPCAPGSGLGELLDGPFKDEIAGDETADCTFCDAGSPSRMIGVSGAAGLGDGGWFSALAFSSRALRSRSRASRCACVTTVILIFFISPASLSISSPDWPDEALGVAALIVGLVPGLRGCFDGPSAASFFCALGCRGTGSFLTAGAVLVFFTARGVVLALIEDSGRILCAVSGRGGRSGTTTVDAALRRRLGALIF